MLEKIIKDIKENLFIRRCLDIVLAMGIFLCFTLIILCIKGIRVGAIDGTDIINVLATVLGGYLGLAGGIIGVLGAYLILKEQFTNEENNKKKEEEIDIKMLKNLLEHTVNETQVIVFEIVMIYTDFYEKYLGGEVLELKCEREEYFLSDLIENLSNKELIKEDIGIFYHIFDCDKLNSSKSIAKEKELTKDEYLNTYSKIYKSYNGSIDYKSLVYDNNWINYIVAVRNNKKFIYDDVHSIIRWLNTLNSNTLEKNQEKIKNIRGEFLSRNDQKEVLVIEKKTKNIELEMISNIRDFIYYRDRIIEILHDESKFGNDESNTKYCLETQFKESSYLLKEQVEGILEKILDDKKNIHYYTSEYREYTECYYY
ncbi:hypothetical protein TPDSL_05210 [Terrisporobacter petrolearius]|uniref:hypothetical protein n=1 Tax=Terrisporobacter petrolearius TaxID=1460447 RepID=UPI0033699EC4